MGYYVRAFCTEGDVPVLRDVLDYARKKGVSLSLGEGSTGVDIDGRDWCRQVELVYKEGKLPIVVGVNRAIESEDSPVKEEVQEFCEFIGRAGLSLVKRRILRHLRRTRFIVRCRVLSDIDDEGYDANGVFLRYFLEHCGALIQADNEGFYEGEKLVLQLD